MKDLWTTLATAMGVLAFFQHILNTIFPAELRGALFKFLQKFTDRFSSYCYYDISDVDGVNTNELYNSAYLYISSSAKLSATRLSLTRAANSSSIMFGLSNNDRFVDSYQGVTVEWQHTVTERRSHNNSYRSMSDEKRGFTLKVEKKFKHVVLDSYLDHITKTAKDLRRKNKERLLYTKAGGGYNGDSWWESVPFNHPSTFDTLAMDPLKKSEIMQDLLEFANGESFYKKTGRAWKRGYLLYGPPGTGKSSMIAAMANFVEFDIYDLELTAVSTNSELRKLLMKTSSKSIIVIEDIDCSVNLSNRKKIIGQVGGDHNSGTTARSKDGGDPFKNMMTLSGLLNFTDGLWSCCGSERIFIFTTNHIDKLDPALLRSGRMDVHLHMGYCSFPALKILVKNYLGIEEEGIDDLDEFEGVVDEAEITPADIGEVLIKNRRDKGRAMGELLEVLKKRVHKKKIGIIEETVNGFGVEEEEEQEKRALNGTEDGWGEGPESSCGEKMEEKIDG